MTTEPCMFISLPVEEDTDGVKVAWIRAWALCQAGVHMMRREGDNFVAVLDQAMWNKFKEVFGIEEKG